MNIEMERDSATEAEGRGSWFESYSRWCSYLETSRERHNERWRFEQAFAVLDPRDLWQGYCQLCDALVRFRLPAGDAGREPNLREEVMCTGCRMNTRVRAGFALAADAVPDRNARIYLTEQASPNYIWLKQRFPDAIGSEYTTDAATKARLRQYLRDLGGRGEIRSEDVTRLTFPDAELDAVVSFDVLEHVPDYVAALREFARVLRPGGALVLTAPFLSEQYDTVTRARIDDRGAIEHLLPPEYHGDPLEGSGILCFYHFGWDLLDRAREAGFSRVGMALPWAPSLGLLGNLWTLLAYR